MRLFTKKKGGDIPGWLLAHINAKDKEIQELQERVEKLERALCYYLRDVELDDHEHDAEMPDWVGGDGHD